MTAVAKKIVIKYGFPPKDRLIPIMQAGEGIRELNEPTSQILDEFKSLERSYSKATFKNSIA